MRKLLSISWVMCIIAGISACATVRSDKPEVHVIGIYEGSYPPNAGHGSPNPYQVEILVNEAQHPVVLVLMSYEPVEWRFTLGEGAKITEVILSSAHPGLVRGLSPDVAIHRESLGITHRRDAAYDKLRKHLSERYGTEPSSFQYGYKGREFSIH